MHFLPSIDGLNANEHILRRRRYILDYQIEIAFAVEEAGLEQLEFKTGPRSTRLTSTI